MVQFKEVVELKSGTPQFRIKETTNTDAPIYRFYGQSDLEADWWGRAMPVESGKQVRTFDSVSTLKTGDVVYSLVSGKAALVSERHDGYLFTHNFVLLKPGMQIAPSYLAYLLDEDDGIRKQLLFGQQGSITMKVMVNQLADLMLPLLPTLRIQELIGTLYFNSLKLETLRNQRAQLETTLIKRQIKEAVQL